MAQTDLEIRKREISALVDGVVSLEQSVLAKGIDARDYGEHAEARDILNRIERKMLSLSGPSKKKVAGA